MSKRLPETPAQAAEWDASKAHYLRLGLCHGCAAQISYGHQQGQGFKEIHPPCTACLPVVLGFPTNEAGEWRSSSRRLKTSAVHARTLVAATA